MIVLCTLQAAAAGSEVSPIEKGKDSKGHCAILGFAGMTKLKIGVFHGSVIALVAEPDAVLSSQVRRSPAATHAARLAPGPMRLGRLAEGGGIQWCLLVHAAGGLRGMLPTQPAAVGGRGGRRWRTYKAWCMDSSNGGHEWQHGF